jgi:hypothetical protein
MGDRGGMFPIKRGARAPRPTPRSPALRVRPPVPPLLAILALPGCQAVLTETTSALAGITGASVATSVGANAAATTGIGLGVQAVGRAGLQYAQRLTHRAAQDRIAAAAGPLPVGGVGAWATDHAVPVEPNESGQVAVSRLISGGALECKEIVFSVDSGRGERTRRGFYIAAVCRDGETWKWASAEPATERWGSLQ